MAVIDTVEVKPLVGEVIYHRRTTNSANHGDFPTAPNDPRVSAWGPGYSNLRQNFQPIATGEGGSPWPYLGSMLAQHWDMPVGFISVGWGGTSVDQWRPYSSVGLYEQIEACFDTGPEGARAVLWHQGERMPQAKRQPQNTPIGCGRSFPLPVPAGWDIPRGVAKAAFLPGLETNALNAVLQGQEAVVQADPLGLHRPKHRGTDRHRVALR